MVKIDVLTYCTGYPYYVFERFAGSLMDTGFKGRLIIVCETNEDIEKINQLRKTYSNVYYYLNETPKIGHINNYRFYAFNDFLNKAGLDSDYILLSDARDVLFQKNIEDYEFDNKYDLFVFNEPFPIYKDLNCNVPWIKDVEQTIGEEFYDDIYDYPVICCGTTIGKVEALRKYIYTMCCFFADFNVIKPLDQGYHMYLIHTDRLDMNVRRLCNDHGLVCTVGCIPPKLNDENKIINDNNEVAYIVHQYDRYPNAVKQKLSDKYYFFL